MSAKQVEPSIVAARVWTTVRDRFLALDVSNVANLA